MARNTAAVSNGHKMLRSDIIRILNRNGTTCNLKARSDVLRKTHQPGLFFTHAKNAAS